MSKSIGFAILLPVLFSTAVLAQPGAIPTPVAAPIDAYQIGYVANLDLADSVVNFSNSGTLILPTGLTNTGNMCVNVYAFDASATLVSCCSCLVAANATNSMSVNNDIVLHTVNRQRPTSMTIKLLATTPLGLSPTGSGGQCDPASPTATPAGPGVFGSLVPGMRASHTSAHKSPVYPGFTITEAPFEPSSLSPAELTRLTLFCSFIKSSGSGAGICNLCQPGAQ
jgi:hypothetical protein